MRNPDSSDLQILAAARSALEAGDLDRARQQLDRVGEAGQELPLALAIRAQLFQADGRLEEARSLYQSLTASSLDDDLDWIVHANYAELLADLGHGAQALRHARLAIEREPAEPDGYVAAARGYLLLQQPSNALSLLNEALELNSEHPNALLLRAGLFAARRSYGDAINDYAHLIDLVPDDSRLYDALAQVAVLGRDADLALSVLAEGAGKVAREEQPLLRERRAALLLAVGRREEGLVEARRLGAENGERSTGFLLARADALLDEEEPGEALVDFERILAREPDNEEALTGKLDALLALEQSEEARALLDQLVISHPSPERYYRRAELLAMQGDLSGARADYEQALTLEPNNASAAYGLALLLLEQGDFEGALSWFDQSIEREPGDEERLLGRSEAYLRGGYPLMAARDAELALDLDDQFIEAYFARAQAMEAMDRYDEALDDLTRALDLDPTFGQALARRARLLARLEQRRVAREDWQRYLQLPPEEQDDETMEEARLGLGPIDL